MKKTLRRPLKLKTLLFVFSLSVVSPLVWSADEYRIDYQIERLDVHGVTTIQKYSEKMIRDEQNIWIERLNIQAHADEANAHSNGNVFVESEAHEHASFDSAIQWMQRKDTVAQPSTANLFQRFYILPAEKMRVQLHDVDQEMLGMKNCWRCEYSLINPDILKVSQPVKREAQLQHYQIHSAGQMLNITWNAQDHIVQRYELLKPTQGYSKTFTVRKMSQHVSTPWQQTEKYSERDYADFSD
ncbi:MAG: hypothetical protein RSA22_08525 [Acinetobacter sp.]